MVKNKIISSTETNKKINNCPLGCDTVYLGRNVLTFRWNLLPPHEERETKLLNKTKIAGMPYILESNPH